MAKRPGRKRLSIDIPIRLHEFITEQARYKNITLTLYVIKALLKYYSQDSRYK